MEEVKRVTDSNRAPKVRKKARGMEHSQAKAGLLFISPWILGFLLFALFPYIFAIYIGFTDWNLLQSSKFIGLKNYIDVLNDPQFWNSLKVTVKFAIFSVVFGMSASIAIALLMNMEIKAISVFRTLYYLPAVVSGVSIALLWRWILDPEFGMINLLLGKIGIAGPGWLTDPDWVIPSYVMMSVWGAGGGMVTYLAGLKDIPKQLYESAEIDGAGMWRRFCNITLPMLTPVIFYNLIMGVIGSLKEFNRGYIMGGAGNQGKFLLVYLYENAFQYYKMGFATAVAWIMFIIILILTLLVFKSSDSWVYYESKDE